MKLRGEEVPRPAKGNPKPRGSKGPARAHAPRGLRLDGTVNVSEPLINVVKVEEPNALTGSSQNGTWPGIPAFISGIADERATGEKAGPNPLLSLTRNRVSPYPRRTTGKPTAREADGGAGKGRRRKRTPPCNGADTGLNVTGRESEQTSAVVPYHEKPAEPSEGGMANEREA